ncbi:MAG: hypothetical protein ACXW04_11830 [Methylobacter sp.]
MNLRTRLENLERRKARSTPKACILVPAGTSREEAIQQWQAEHPGKPVPQDPFIINLVPFTHEQP